MAERLAEPAVLLFAECAGGGGGMAEISYGVALHDNWSKYLAGKADEHSARHLKLKFEEFDQGFIYKRIREGAGETDVHWTMGRVCLWPNGFYLANHFEWRVPVDDENTLTGIPQMTPELA